MKAGSLANCGDRITWRSDPLVSLCYAPGFHLFPIFLVPMQYQSPRFPVAIDSINMYTP